MIGEWFFVNEASLIKRPERIAIGHNLIRTAISFCATVLTIPMLAFSAFRVDISNDS